MANSGITAFNSLVAAAVLAAIPAMVSAQAVTKDQVISDLTGEGFMVVDTGTTLLGRIRITALGPDGTREVVLNPRNGKVLRDTIIEDAPERQPETATSAKVEPVATQTLAPVEPAEATPERTAPSEMPAPAASASAVAIEAIQDRAAERGTE